MEKNKKLFNPFNNFHVYPVGDIREHITEGGNDFDCWCKPEIEGDFPPYSVIHRQLDPRYKIKGMLS